jgi:predicted HD phosphohydrolase
LRFGGHFVQLSFVRFRASAGCLLVLNRLSHPGETFSTRTHVPASRHLKVVLEHLNHVECSHVSEIQFLVWVESGQASQDDLSS